MAKAPKEYRRLTRNVAALGTYSSLWAGADHLIIVRSTGYHENYQRLQLADLKGIFLIATSRRLAWAFFWGVMAGVSAMTIVISLMSHGTPIVSWIFLTLGVVGLVGNHLAGEGCRAYILTGVQTADLPPVLRLKQARRVLRELQPLIAAAQANLTVAPAPVAVATNPGSAVPTEVVAASAPAPAEIIPPPPPETPAPPAA
jgi:hypothetical protein